MEASLELRSPCADGLQFPLEQIVVQVDLALILLPVHSCAGQSWRWRCLSLYDIVKEEV